MTKKKETGDKEKGEEPEEEDGPHPVRDALLRAIEYPEEHGGGPTSAKQGQKLTEIPLVEIKSILGGSTSKDQVPRPSIIEKKLSSKVEMIKTERKVDMYREQF